MRYTVIWLPGPLSDLADIWNNAPDQRAVADAANRIDRWLKYAPTSVGVPGGVERVLAVAPLAVSYRVLPNDCKVEVAQVIRLP